MKLIQPALQDEAFLADVHAAPDEEGLLHFWWLGQSGFLLKWQGHHLLFDPYLSDSLTVKYADTDKPHIRMTERVVAPEKLDFIDLVTSSHNHTDHLDRETLGPLLEVNPKLHLVLPEANEAFALERLGCEPKRLFGLHVGDMGSIPPFDIHPVPAAHEALEKDEKGRFKFQGYVVQFGPWTVYHSGDTVRFDGMTLQIAIFTPDIAFLPINGRKPERRVAGNLNGIEAAELAKEIKASVAVPCHYEMFTFNTEPPDAFIEAAEKIGQTVVVPRAGERVTLEKEL